MRILIVGAGALGGMVGAYLTRSGEDVVLLDTNTARARHLNDAGLLITRVGEDEVCHRVRVVTSVEGQPPFDLVFVAVKTYQTEAAIGDALPAAAARARFLSLQNGIGNAERIAELVGAERVLCGITYHSVQHAGPGRLHFRVGVKPIQIAPFAGEVTAEIEAIGDTFRRAGLNTDVVERIDHVVWQKLLHNAVINPVSALTGLTCREILGDGDLLAFMRDLCLEIVAVMRARGVPIVDEEDPFRPLIGSLRALGKNRPTMWQDLARGKRTEIDALNGAVVMEAERLGLLAPHNAALVRFVHSREQQAFLRRQEIARRLGLERPVPSRTAAVPAPPLPHATATAAVPLARRRPPASTGDPVGLPFRCAGLLASIVSEHYRNLGRASDDPWRLVAACSNLAPVEVVRALGITPYFPEHHAAMIGASGMAASYFARSGMAGMSQFTSSAMRADIGALIDGSSPLFTEYGLRDLPRPDLALYSTNAGAELRRWFEFYGTHYGIPVLGLHPPPATDGPDAADVDLEVRQMLRLIARMERMSGVKLDMEQLAETVRHSEQATRLWGEILDMARGSPAPVTFFEMLVHMAPIVLLRGTPEAVAYYGELRDELADRLGAGVASVPNETSRFYWEGQPVWCALRAASRLFAGHGAAVVGSTFAATFRLPGLDPMDPVQSLSQAYATVVGNRSEAFTMDYLSGQFTQLGVDAAVFHDCRTTPESNHARYGLASRMEELTGVPCLVLEADAHDARLFSPERLDRQLGEFVERQAGLMAAH